MTIKDVESGKVYKQVTPFQTYTNDWNNDNDVYTMYGAYFRSKDNCTEFVENSLIDGVEYAIVDYQR